MATGRQQLNADDLTRLKWLLGSLLALFSAWSVFFMDIDAWLLLGAITMVSVAGIVRPEWPSKIPRWVHRLAFPAILAIFAVDLYSSREPLPALLRLDLLLILYRLMTHRRRREDLQLVVLGLFLIVVGGVISVSLAFAVQIVAFTACALTFLFLVHLSEPGAPSSQNIEYTETPAWTRGSWRDVFRRSMAATDPRLVALGVVLFAGVVAVSGLLFLAIPRFDFQGGLFLDRLMSRSTFTGFSDAIEFGEVTAITQEDGLALTVDVDDPAALPSSPYWRMVVLDEYTGTGFRMSQPLRQALERVRTGRVEAGVMRQRPQAAHWTLYLEAGISRYLPLLGDFRRLEFNELQTFAAHDATAVVALQRDPAKMVAYRVQGMVAGAALQDAGLALARKSGRRMDASLSLTLAETDRMRIDRLLRDIAPAADDAQAFSRTIVSWLERNHGYSLQSTLPRGEGDPLVRWLDSTTPGHCEFFAGSFVLLARAAGYPARLVAGFRGGSWNAYSGSFAVRNTNAHAWCEIFDDASGTWLRVDPTPGSGGGSDVLENALDGRGVSEPDRGWRARLESLRVFWYRRVVNFDQDTQLELATAAKGLLQDAGQRLRAWVDARAASLRRWLDKPWDPGRVGSLVVVAFGILLIGWLWRRRGRSWWLLWRSRSRRSSKHHDPVRLEAGRWLARLKATRDSPSGEAGEIWERLLRLRYGAPSTWPDPGAVFRAARKACRERTGPVSK